MWPKLAEGVVGKVCRNKQYNELRVVGEDGREMWTKVGTWLFAGGLVRGERVLVRKVWGSGDDTDAEYEVVRRMDVNEEVPQVPTVVEPPLVEPSAVSELETPVAIGQPTSSSATGCWCRPMGFKATTGNASAGMPWTFAAATKPSIQPNDPFNRSHRPLGPHWVCRRGGLPVG